MGNLKELKLKLELKKKINRNHDTVSLEKQVENEQIIINDEQVEDEKIIINDEQVKDEKIIINDEQVSEIKPKVESKIIKEKIRWDINKLQVYVQENNIKLIGEYIKVTNISIIKGYCKTDMCNNKFEKDFRCLIRHCGGPYCEGCTLINQQFKMEQTCIDKYGVSSVMKNDFTKEKRKQTLIKKYGENPMSNEKIQEKSKRTCLAKYGVEHVIKNKNIREKQIQTLFKNHAVLNPMYNFKIKEKYKRTMIEKYGVTTPLKNINSLIKLQLTCIERYGVPYYSQQSSNIIKKNSYMFHDYISSSGIIFQYQGYEKFALDYLLNIKNINDNDIVNKRSDVPEIFWTDKYDDLHRHFVDIYIISKNKCIEVKSTWTFELQKENVFLKQKAAKELGYNYQIWIFDKKGNRIAKYK